jgi:predicted nucleic acid-binding protein
VLVDTSVWIQVFRKTAPLDLRAHVEPGDVVTCLPIAQEVLQGFRDDAAFRKARVGLDALLWVESPLTREVVDDAVGLYRAARKRGLTIRSSVDCLIAACAIRHDLVVLHADRDYAALARISRLRQRSV